MTNAEENSPQFQPQRVIGLDVARGALMAYVVIVIHGLWWLQLVHIGIASLFLFEMPPIFAIAGAAYLLSERAKPSRRPSTTNYIAFLARRFLRIMIPYWSYALVCAAFMVTTSGGQDGLATVWSWINPMTAGGGHAALTLNWHLWFVLPFLAVTALMPLLKRVPAPDLPLWLWAAAGAAFIAAADALDSSRDGYGQTIAFYALWTTFGYALAAAPVRYGPRDYAVVLVLALGALAASYVLIPGAARNMQYNKFPPNMLFYFFSCAWMAILLTLAGAVSDRRVAAFARSSVLRPFIRSGYSIYIWQGLGYSAALLIGGHFHWSNWVVWPLAVAATIVLGTIAAPLEKIRLPSVDAV